MTTLRRELRETLQWCLKQQLPFTGLDMCESLSRERFSINRQLRLLVNMDVLSRTQLRGSGMPYQYNIVDRDRAMTLAYEQPKTRYEKAQVKRYTPGVSFIFNMGAQ